MSYYYNDVYGDDDANYGAHAVDVYGGAGEADEAKNKAKKAKKLTKEEKEQRRSVKDRSRRALYLHKRSEKHKEVCDDEGNGHEGKRHECMRLTPRQSSRRAFKFGTHGFKNMGALRTNGHKASRDDLKRVKHGRYVLNIAHARPAQFLAWQAAQKEALGMHTPKEKDGITDQKNKDGSVRHALKVQLDADKHMIVPNKNGTLAQREVYDAIKIKYDALIADGEKMGKFEAKAAKTSAAAKKHNAALYARTGGHNKYLWAVAKFNVDDERDGGKPAFRARADSHSADERDYYDEIKVAYDTLVGFHYRGEGTTDDYDQLVYAYEERIRGDDAIKLARAKKEERLKAAGASDAPKAAQKPKAAPAAQAAAKAAQAKGAKAAQAKGAKAAEQPPRRRSGRVRKDVDRYDAGAQHP